MSKDFLSGWVSALCFALVSIVTITTWRGAKPASSYCPAVLGNAPDTLAVVQGFPKCLKYTRVATPVEVNDTTPDVWYWQQDSVAWIYNADTITRAPGGTP